MLNVFVMREKFETVTFAEDTYLKAQMILI